MKETKKKEDLQQRNDVALWFRIRRSGVRGHPNLEATTENRACDVIFDCVGKVSLVYDREHVVTSVNAIRRKTGVLEHEDMVLRIRNDRGLVLRYLHDRQTLEVDNRIRHCPIQKRRRSVGSSSPHDDQPAYIRTFRCKYAPTSSGMGNLDTVQVL